METDQEAACCVVERGSVNVFLDNKIAYLREALFYMHVLFSWCERFFRERIMIALAVESDVARQEEVCADGLSCGTAKCLCNISVEECFKYMLSESVWRIGEIAVFAVRDLKFGSAGGTSYDDALFPHSLGYRESEPFTSTHLKRASSTGIYGVYEKRITGSSRELGEV